MEMSASSESFTELMFVKCNTRSSWDWSNSHSEKDVYTGMLNSFFSERLMFYSLKALWNPPYIKGKVKIERGLSASAEDRLAK